jgi:hypothetical protein
MAGFVPEEDARAASYPSKAKGTNEEGRGEAGPKKF